MDLSTLNSRQKEAVTYTEGRIRVVAGAGSGKTKGLEFPYVFIIGLSDVIFPNARSIRERKKNALEEERRLQHAGTQKNHQDSNQQGRQASLLG